LIRLKEKNRKKGQGKGPGEARLANNRYVIVATFLPETETYLILQPYRIRRQIEPVFTRHRTQRVRNPRLDIIRYRQKLEYRRKPGFTASYYGRRFVKPGFIKPVFPPVRRVSSAESKNESIRRGLWREQRIMLFIVVYAPLTSFHTFQRLPCGCAGSKRQRVPALFRPLHPIPK
jgi:hypothetical protein